LAPDSSVTVCTRPLFPSAAMPLGQPGNSSVATWVIRCPLATGSPWCWYSLRSENAASAGSCASWSWRSNGSSCVRASRHAVGAATPPKQADGEKSMRPPIVTAGLADGTFTEVTAVSTPRYTLNILRPRPLPARQGCV
jgi:hypothetical protein